ncbi:MAG: type II secretion system protein [Pyrinomonadaceae bacterium]
MHRHSNQRGFSLLEMVFVMGIMLVVTTAVLSMLRDTLKFSNVTYEMSDSQQNLRTAHESINRDIMSAGDGLLGLNNIKVSKLFVNNYLTTTPVADPVITTISPLTIVTSDNNVASGTAIPGIAPSVNVRSSPALTDRLTILDMADTTAPANNVNFPAVTLDPGGLGAINVNSSGYNVTVDATTYAAVSVNDIYFFSSSAGQTLGRVTAKVGPNTLRFYTSDTYGLNTIGANGSLKIVANTPGIGIGPGTLPVTMTRLFLIHYFVDQNGLLYRRVFGIGGGVGFSDSVIAEHVTDLQFNFYLKAATAGAAAQPTTTQLNISQQSRVREVEVTIKTETAHNVLNGAPQETKMTTTTAIRNMQFRESQQPTSNPG